MAFADLVVETPTLVECYSPSEEGDVNLDVPMEVTFEDPQATYKRFVARSLGRGVDTYTRPSMFDTRTYSLAGESRRPLVNFRLVQSDETTGRWEPWAHCMKVAGQLRHAAAEALEEMGWAKEEIASYVQGHTAEDEKARRVSYVPLPGISGPYPDGRIRRVMIVEPAGESGRAVQALRRTMNGRALTNEKANLTAYVAVAEAGADPSFASYFDPDKKWRVWRSVTPVILHGFNVQRKGVIDMKKTLKLLTRAFEMAGCAPDSIEALSFQTGPLWRGTGHASAMLAPRHLAKYPRLHVEVVFKEPIRGPVMAGIGRHYGIGVFAEGSVAWGEVWSEVNHGPLLEP